VDSENPYAPPAAEVVSTGTPDTDLGNAERTRLDHLHQEAVIRAYGCLGICVALFGSVWLVLLLELSGSQSVGGQSSGLRVEAIAAAGVSLVGVALFVLGVGLLGLKPWSRMVGLVLAVCALPLVPVGTLLGGALLWVLTSAKGRAVLSAKHGEVRARTRHVKPWPLTSVIFFALLLTSALATGLVISLFVF
jgi:hypothetical protein